MKLKNYVIKCVYHKMPEKQLSHNFNLCHRVLRWEERRTLEQGVAPPVNA